MVPLLISEEEWSFIEAGIIQRADLLSRLLEDLYGPQKLLTEGRFPAALLYGNPAFLRPLVGVAVPRASYLHMLAVDLARSPDGQWWVLADRTQAPSGSGYALENRTIVSDLLPELFRDSNVQRLAPFFRAQRDALIGMAGCENPRVVLHTPGPHNETYFEHSFLAKYLGFTLVVGADMTVRDRRVYLKTVSGLEQVDVILRRVDDGFCDPLELRGDSLARGCRAGGCDCGGQCDGGERARQRVDRISCDHAVPARAFATSAGRRVEAALGRYLVVRSAAARWTGCSTIWNRWW